MLPFSALLNTVPQVKLYRGENIMPHESKFENIMQKIIMGRPAAYADIKGSREFSRIRGRVNFFKDGGGTVVYAQIYGLPKKQDGASEPVFGFHIHSGRACTGNKTDPFADTDGHYNPRNLQHPYHAGDMPPLFANDGYALMTFYTERFLPRDILGRTVVIHDMPDDFHTQPAGDSGMKIACGIIKA